MYNLGHNFFNEKNKSKRLLHASRLHFGSKNFFTVFFKLLPVKMTLIAIKTSIKNEKSKAVFMGAKFHKKMVFSVFN